MGTEILNPLETFLAQEKKPKPEDDSSDSEGDDSSDSHDDDRTEDNGTMKAPGLPTYESDTEINGDGVTPV